MPVPNYFGNALWARRRTALMNRTPLPVVVLHPDFYHYVLRECADGCNITLVRGGYWEFMGMRLRPDHTVPLWRNLVRIMIVQKEGLPIYQYDVTRYPGHAGKWLFYALAEINGLPYEVMFLSEPYQDVNEFLAQAIPFAEQALKNRVQAEQKAMQQANDDQQAS